jgi:hypothetical protein
MKRHPELVSLRKPQAVSAARVKGFYRANVSVSFSILETEMEKIKFSPNRLFNVDEAGITVVQHKTSKVIRLKGKCQVASLSSDERGAILTTVPCMGSSGHFVPPLLVLPRKNVKPELLDDAQPGTIAACHPSGWI